MLSSVTLSMAACRSSQGWIGEWWQCSGMACRNIGILAQLLEGGIHFDIMIPCRVMQTTPHVLCWSGYACCAELVFLLPKAHLQLLLYAVSLRLGPLEACGRFHRGFLRVHQRLLAALLQNDALEPAQALLVCKKGLLPPQSIRQSALCWKRLQETCLLE